IASARKPIASDSPSAMIPRMIGSRRTRWRAIFESIERETWAIPPLGVRTATAQFPGPRIITPSRTACPPTVEAMEPLAATAALGALSTLEALLEALDASAAVHELLLARVEGVAVRAHLDVQLRLGRPRLECVPARARHRRKDVLGVDVSLHVARIAAACFGATLPPETMATTVWPGSTRTAPERSAAVVAAARSSHASFMR